jgi:hypothetical protein
MPTPSYITKPSGFCWHILRPDERYLVWCQADMDGPTWTQITLNVPASVCHMCRDAEAVSLTTDLDRIPALDSVF